MTYSITRMGPAYVVGVVGGHNVRMLQRSHGPHLADETNHGGTTRYSGTSC